MATSIRGLATLIAAAVVTALQAGRLDMLSLRSGVVYHADATAPPATTPTATDLPTSLAKLAADSAAYVAHIASACSATTGQGAHITADVTDVFTTPAGVDLATGNARANELKAIWNTHIASTAYHAAADSVNTVTATDAVLLASLVTLVNQIDTLMAAHIASALGAQAIQLVAP